MPELDPDLAERTWSVLALVIMLYVPQIVVLALLAWRDMNRRGRPGIAYAAAVLALPVAGVPWWLLQRENDRGTDLEARGQTART